MSARTLLLFPGDGIGPEVVDQLRRVIQWMNSARGTDFETEDALVGGAAYDVHNVCISEEDVQRAIKADAILFGAVGGPKWDTVPYEHRPEAGLLRLRKELDLFANLRPALCYAALADSSSLKRELVEGLDILILRELTGGTYFGEPKEITELGDGTKRAVDTTVYDTGEIERIAKVAFELARVRSGRVCSMEKRNVMVTGVLWNEVVSKAGKRRALYEPVHGSAPDIAGTGQANPIAMIASFAMCLRYSFDLVAEAELLESAISGALDAGVRTGDIMSEGLTQVSTEGMGDTILAQLDALSKA